MFCIPDCVEGRLQSDPESGGDAASVVLALTRFAEELKGRPQRRLGIGKSDQPAPSNRSHPEPPLWSADGRGASVPTRLRA